MNPIRVLFRIWCQLPPLPPISVDTNRIKPNAVQHYSAAFTKYSTRHTDWGAQHLADFRVASGAQAARELCPYLDLVWGINGRAGQGL